jgi:hypothetical protein
MTMTLYYVAKHLSYGVISGDYEYVSGPHNSFENAWEFCEDTPYFVVHTTLQVDA